MSQGTDNRSASTDETVAGLTSAELAQTESGGTAGFHAGQVLEQRYRLVTLLGRGAMGEVWEAQHVAIGRRVAIKLIAPNAVHDDLATRLQREAEFVARLEHPNIVAVTDFGLVEAGAPFVVMERLTGRTLAEHIGQRGRLDGTTARTIVDQLAAGLGHAHRAGIVHRDLKPSNVFVLDDAAGPVRVKIIDFGIAKATAIDPSDRALTRVGAVFGTPAYMAPEQIRGDPLDARADLYALGAILYEMLVGEPPWRRRTSVELMYCHLFEPIPSVRMRVPDAPAELEAIVMWCMAKDRALRPPDADALRGALHGHGIARGATFVPLEPPPQPSPELRARYASAPPVVPGASNAAPLAPVVERARLDRSRAPTTWWILGAVVVTLVTGAVLAAWSKRRHRAAQDDAVVEIEAAPAVAVPVPTSDPPTPSTSPPPTEPLAHEADEAAHGGSTTGEPPTTGDGTIMRDVRPPPSSRNRNRNRDGGRSKAAPTDLREPFEGPPARRKTPQRRDETFEWPDP